MSKEIQTIGVLTSGGDAPGMNAAIVSCIVTATLLKRCLWMDSRLPTTRHKTSVNFLLNA